MWPLVKIHHSCVQAGDYDVKRGGNSDISECTHLHESTHNKWNIKLKTLSQPSSPWPLASLYFHFHKHRSAQGPVLLRDMRVTQLFTPSIMGHFSLEIMWTATWKKSAVGQKQPRIWLRPLGPDVFEASASHKVRAWHVMSRWSWLPKHRKQKGVVLKLLSDGLQQPRCANHLLAKQRYFLTSHTHKMFRLLKNPRYNLRPNTSF